MATRLPTRQSSRSGRRGSGGSLTAENVPFVSPQQDPGVRGLGGAFGEDAARGIRELGATGQQFAGRELALEQERQQRLLSSFNKIMETQDAQEILVTKQQFKEVARQKLQDMRRRNEISERDAVENFQQFLSDTSNQLMEGAKLSSELKKEELENTLLGVQFEIADEFGVENTKARQEQAWQVVQREFNDFKSGLPEDQTMEDYRQSLKDFLSFRQITDMITAEQESLAFTAGMEVGFVERFNKMMNSGDLEDAEELLETYQFEISDPAADRARDRLESRRKNLAVAQQEAEKEVVRAEKIFGKPVEEFTASEQMMVFTGSIPQRTQVPVDEIIAQQEEAMGRTLTDDERKIAVGIAEKASGFTLGENQKRFDAGGNEIARGPQEPTGAELGRLEADQIIAREQALEAAGIELKNKKSDLLDEQGNLKQEVSSELRKQAVLQFGGSLDNNGNVVGVSQEQAQSLASMQSEAANFILNGKAKSIEQAIVMARANQPPGTFQKDQTFIGAAETLEQLTTRQFSEELEPLPEVSEENAKAEIERFRETAENMKNVDLGDATGIVSGAIQLWNNIMGQFSPSFENTEVTKARMQLAILGRDMLLLLAQNPRIPVAEQQAILGIFKEPSVFNTPEGARTQIRTLRRMLDGRIADSKSMLRVDLGEGGKDMKMEMLGRLQSYWRIKALTDRFDVSPGGSTTVSITPDTTPTQINKMSKQDIREFVNKSDEEFLNSLPQKTQSAIKKKLGVK